jgi:hypothetical protein
VETMRPDTTGVDGRLPGLVASVSHKGVKSVNEDWVHADSLGQWQMFALADGVSSSLRAEEAARICVDTFFEVVGHASTVGKKMSVGIFRKAYRRCAERLRYASQGIMLERPELQTTLIAVVEASEGIFMTYLGDGEIWLMNADGWAIPLMIPHSDGSLLTGALTADGIKGNPVFIEYSKSFDSGEIVIAGTDGAFGTEGGAKALIPRVQEMLTAEQAADNGELEKGLYGLLEALHKEHSLGDNASLGVIVTSTARARFQAKKV